MKEIKLLIDDNAEVLVITSCGYLRHNMFNTEVCFNTETIVLSELSSNTHTMEKFKED